MIVIFKNGELTNEEEFLKTDEKKETVTHLKINDDFVSINNLPSLLVKEKEILYLTQGMMLYLLCHDKKYEITKFFAIEQEVRQNVMKIKNICSSIILANDNPFLAYCQFKKDEKDNIKNGIADILNDLCFISDKEKLYLTSKVEEFFAEKTSGKIIKDTKQVGRATRIEYNGETFNTIVDFRRKYKINPSTLYRALENGMTIEEIVRRYARSAIGQKSKRSGIPIEYDGVRYDSKSEFCDAYGLILSNVNVCMKNGKSLDEIVAKYAKKRPQKVAEIESGGKENERN